MLTKFNVFFVKEEEAKLYQVGQYYMKMDCGSCKLHNFVQRHINR